MKIVKHKNAILTVAICILIITASLIFISRRLQSDNPHADVIIELRNISDQEYESNMELRKHNIQDLKKLFIQVDITNSKSCRQRDIYIPDIYAAINTDRERTLSGGDSYINNLRKDSSAQSMKYVIFDCAGLTVDDIKKLYHGSNISVNIKTSNNKDLIYNYNIGELMKEVRSND